MDLVVYGSGSGPQPFKTAADYDRFLERVRQFPRWVDGAIAHDAHRHVARHHRCRDRRWPRWCRSCATSSRRRPRPAFSGGRSRPCPRTFPAAERQRISAGVRGGAQRRKCCRPTRASRISSSATIYRRRAPRWAGAICPTARRGIAGAFAARPPWTCRRSRSTSSASREVARIRAEMLAVKEQVGFKGDLDAFFKHLEDDPQFYFTSEQELLDAYRDVKRRIDALAAETVLGFPQGRLRDPPGGAVPRGLRRGRFLPGAVGRRQAAGHLLHQHATTCRRSRASASKRCRCTRRRRAITSRSPSSRS